MLFVHCRVHRRLRANTFGNIKRFSGCYYPRCYRLQLFRTATAGCSCTPRNLNRNHFWKKRFRWHNPSLGRRDCDGEEQTNNKLGQNRVSLKGIYVWGVNSKVTKQSDHYVWMDMSERVVRRCHDTVDKKQVNSCVLKHLFLETVEQPKIPPKKNRKCFLRRATNVKILRLTPTKTKPRSVRFFETALRAVLIN